MTKFVKIFVAVLLAMPTLARTENQYQLSIPAIAREAKGAVVSIVMFDKTGKPISQGSGFLISSDGRVVTNYHVIRNGASAILKLPGGAQSVVDGVLAIDKNRDIAVIKAHGDHFHIVQLGNSDRLQVGQEVVAIGNPLSLESTVSNGILSAIRTVEKGGKVLQITAPISPGSSGGPLFDMAGQVIGVTAAYIKGGQNLNFAVPINEVKRLLRPEYAKIRAFPDEPGSTEDQTVGQGDNGPVCGFITKRIMEEVPQVPTSCEQKEASEADIYSPTNVLEGGTRRAWSTALFRAIQDSVSRGPCGGEGGCQISFSDSTMSQLDVHYEVGVDRNLSDLLQRVHIDSFSDEWYLAWWTYLVRAVRTSPGSTENAGLIAHLACQEYTQTTGLPGVFARPQCSTLLKTKERVDVVLDFQSALDANLFDNNIPLLTTFGKAFDLTGYEGDVIIRTPWNQGSRIYVMYPLRVLCFFWEEIQSGSRREAAATIDAMEDRVPGQQEEYPNSSAQKQNQVHFRSAAVVRIFPSKDTEGFLADLTDGSEWLLSADARNRCDLEMGSEVNVLVVGGKAHLSLAGRNHGCDLNAKFVRGW